MPKVGRKGSKRKRKRAVSQLSKKRRSLGQFIRHAARIEIEPLRSLDRHEQKHIIQLAARRLGLSQREGTAAFDRFVKREKRDRDETLAEKVIVKAHKRKRRMPMAKAKEEIRQAKFDLRLADARGTLDLVAPMIARELGISVREAFTLGRSP